MVIKVSGIRTTTKYLPQNQRPTVDFLRYAIKTGVNPKYLKGKSTSEVRRLIQDKETDLIIQRLAERWRVPVNNLARVLHSEDAVKELTKLLRKNKREN